MPYTVPLFIEGKKIKSESGQLLNVLNPATQMILAKVPLSTKTEIDKAINSATNGFKAWQKSTPTERMRLMMRYQYLLKQNQKDIATILSSETGKIFSDSMGDVWRGIEVVEQAANIASSLMGESLNNVATEIDTINYRYPLGVCLGITPFNFPAMIPLWMFPLAIACGNTFILKPSEQTPLTSVKLIELFFEAGAPKNIIQLIHGSHEQAEYLVSNTKIKAVSFVGSIQAAQSVYKNATANLKRAQCFAGAKNHMVIMPDANKNQVINNLISSSIGAAGQRCMAISVAVFVGKSKNWETELSYKMSKCTPGVWNDNKSAFGPLISKKAKERVLQLIKQGKQEGAKCLLDGSLIKINNYNNGNWIGPTLFTDVTSSMSIYKEEIFGPVLCCVKVATLEDAISFVNANCYGNGTSIFTSSGAAARKYQTNIDVGMVGINVPIPVPIPMFSFTGWKNSFYGDHHAYGKEMIRFYTKTKTVTTRWYDDNIIQNPEYNMTIDLR